MISPWIKKARVVKGAGDEPDAEKPSPNSEFEHSSFPGTFKSIFNLKSYLNRHDAWAAKFDFITKELTSPRTDCPVKLPNAPEFHTDAPSHPVAGTMYLLWEKWWEQVRQRIV